MIKIVERGELYFADLSPVIGSEQDGLRPVLVIQSNRYNTKSPTTIVAAVTSKNKRPTQRSHVVLSNASILPGSIILLEQIRTVDKTRLGTYIGKLTKHEMRQINKAIRESLALEQSEVLKNDCKSRREQCILSGGMYPSSVGKDGIP